MAFTTVSNIDDLQDAANTIHYYYPKDITMLMNQFGAQAIVAVRVVYNGKEEVALMAAQNIGKDGVGSGGIMDKPDNLIILPCPPFGGIGREGGRMIPNEDEPPV